MDACYWYEFVIERPKSCQVQRLSTVAERRVRVRMDLDHQPVGPDSDRRPATGGTISAWPVG